MADPLMRRLLGVCALLGTVASAAANLADPTRPPLATPIAAGAPAAAPAPSFTLQSIVFGPQRRLAVINGHQVHEGSALGEAKVMRIEREAVVLELEGHRQVLSLYATATRAAPVSLTRHSAGSGGQGHE